MIVEKIGVKIGKIEEKWEYLYGRKKKEDIYIVLF